MEAESDHLVGYQIEVMNYAAVNSGLKSRKGCIHQKGVVLLVSRS